MASVANEVSAELGCTVQQAEFLLRDLLDELNRLYDALWLPETVGRCVAETLREWRAA